MTMRTILLGLLALVLAACGPAPTTGPGGAQIYRISSADARQIPLRIEDSVNSLRAAAGVPPVSLNSDLTRAASAHARDMAAQNRPWHFGSDGSSPLDRVRRTGFTGQFLGETISETFETELETLAAWMEQPDTRAVILDPAARALGFAWHQERSGKIWYTLVTGTPPGPGGVRPTGAPGAASVASAPFAAGSDAITLSGTGPSGEGLGDI